MRISLVGVLLLACAACAGGEEPAPDPVVVDPERPCRFATSAEVAAAVDGEAGDARAVEGRSKDGTILCTYDVGAPYSTVSLYVETGVSEDEFRERMERDPLNTDPLEGAGDVAFTHASVGVSVWEDGDAASASVQHFDDPDTTREALVNLAELIDSKL